METKDQIGDFLIKKYIDLFKAENFNHMQAFDGFFQATVTEAQNSKLSCIPSREEILKAVKSIHLSKAPGPNGMSAMFFQIFWDTIGDDVTETIQNIFRHGVFP